MGASPLVAVALLLRLLLLLLLLLLQNPLLPASAADDPPDQLRTRATSLGPPGTVVLPTVLASFPAVAPTAPAAAA